VVSEIDERMVVSPSAYCLFYRKKWEEWIWLYVSRVNTKCRIDDKI
jgi:hypothetical protein